MAKKRSIYSPEAGSPIGPYSQAVRAGDLLFISGQIPLDAATGQLVQDSFEAETRQVMKNLEYILKAAGLSFAHVAKSSIFLKDLEKFPVVNQIYGEYFPEGRFPARETVEVARLPKDVNVEISMIAHY